MASETKEHQKLKELMSRKLEEWFGVTITEYSSTGHELDVFSISPKGLKLMVEIIWTPTASNFFRDLTILYQSDAQIKVLFVNDAILSKKELVREFQKARISETRKGCVVPAMINGTKILNDPKYLETDVHKLFNDLISESQLSVEVEIEELGNELLSSNTNLSPIIVKSIELSKKFDDNNENILWLKNELHGYEDFMRIQKKEFSEPSDFPNNPDYRKISGTIKMAYRNVKTRRIEVMNIDTSVMLTQPCSELERLEENFRGSKEFMMPFPKNYFPKVKGLDVDKIPVICKSSSLEQCLEGLKLRIHKYLMQELMSKVKD